MQTKIAEYKNKHNSGFTLVELSIVIVIIGLIIAGVTSGQKMVAQAKLRNAVKEIQTYDTATKQFVDKFKYYPGDLPTAATYWGTYSAGPPITGASNGNGDWIVSFVSGTEDLQFWRQLALAGYIPGSYTGAVGAVRHVAGVNCPASVIPKGGYQVFYTTSGATNYSTYGQSLQLGTPAGDHYNESIMSPSDAYSIDTKIDDGIAATGNLYVLRAASLNGTAGKCVTAGWTAATATWTLTDTTVSCRLIWWLNKNR